MTSRDRSEEGVRIVTLGAVDSSLATERRCRQLLAGRTPLHPTSEPVPLILILAPASLTALDDWCSRHGDAIDLLIALDDAALDRAAILLRCQQVILAPFDDEALGRQLDALFTDNQWDPLLADLLESNIVGRSERIRALRRRIQNVARYVAPVAIEGETGTGKELAARAVHYCSTRRDASFIPINCAALNDELLLSELFGHERGAFTDARQARRGLVAQADGGTLFLDEVDSLSARAQGALLRFLQDREYRPVGSERLMHADVRVICATNRNFRRCVTDGHFREDLYYRLNVIELSVPPLRERHGDIEILADLFLNKLSARYEEPQKRLHPMTLQWMHSYDWPGNVRELENYLHRCHVMCGKQIIYMPSILGDPLPIDGGAKSASIFSFQLEKERAVVRFERDYLVRVLESVEGNISAAARRAGKERRAFTRLLEKHGIDSRLYRTLPNHSG